MSDITYDKKKDDKEGYELLIMVGLIVFVIPPAFALGASFPTILILVFLGRDLISYWLPPLPRTSYLRWAIAHTLTWIGLLISLFKLPILLHQWIPLPLAFGLPTFTFLLAGYWIRQLLSGEIKISYTKWVMRSMLIAIAIATLFTLLFKLAPAGVLQLFS